MHDAGMRRAYHWLMHACGIGAALTIGVMALLVTFDVIARNTGLGSFPWVVEVSEYSLPLATFLVDASLTLGRRMLRGEAWWQPHVQHAYQVWSRRLGRHAPVTLAYAGWSAAGAAVMLGVNMTHSTFIIAPAAALGWCLVSAAGWWVLQRVSQEGKGRIQQK